MITYKERYAEKWRVSMLRELISNWRRLKLIPPGAFDTANQYLKSIMKQLKKVN
jgi:hypothetical protein